MRSEFVGSILAVRAVEDTIRATKKYTKGAFQKPIQHPIQGEEFPSHVLTEYYEVYPDTEIGWDMPASEGWAWLWGDTMHVDILFKYNYHRNRAIVIIHGGDEIVKLLNDGIPSFGEALSKVFRQDTVDAEALADEPTIRKTGSKPVPYHGESQR